MTTPLTTFENVLADDIVLVKQHVTDSVEALFDLVQFRELAAGAVEGDVVEIASRLKGLFCDAIHVAVQEVLNAATEEEDHDDQV